MRIQHSEDECHRPGTRRGFSTAVSWAASCLVLLACGSGNRAEGPSLRVEGAWARVAPLLASSDGAEGTGTNSAAYMVLANDGGVADRLVGGSSPAARGVQLHESRMEDGVMTMRQLDGVEIPPGEEVQFRPAGRHLMLVDLSQGLLEGDTIDLVLEFERSGPLGLKVPVRMSGEG
jgi:copper(I)-binding protein